MTTDERCENMEFDPTQVVARYLKSKGYDILERGWSCPKGRADIIARDGGDIVFAVATESTDDALWDRALARLNKAAASYEVPEGLSPRFDIVWVKFNQAFGNEVRLIHYRGVSQE